MPTGRLVFRSEPTQTARRVAALRNYFNRNVLAGKTFKCQHRGACRASYSGRLIEGQLHHVGKHYDLTLNGRPFRVAVIGQEFGHGRSCVSLAERHEMIREFGTQRRFFAEDGFPARNPHMRATTSLLRLLFGRGLGADYAGEYVTLAGKSVHLFEMFALVNFLLCSAVTKPEPPTFHGGQRGRSTRVMREHCAEHVRAGLEILCPTVVVAQGRSVHRWLGMVWDAVEPAHETLPLERVRLGTRSMLLASFVHPSAPTKDNWGANAGQPYLLKTVAPTIDAVLAMCGPPHSQRAR